VKLYYAPSSCALAPHIALVEAGLSFDLAKVNLRTHTLEDGGDFYRINPLGYVPVLELDDGFRLRECSAVLQCIADQAPAKNLAPANGTPKRYQLQEWLSFISVELHKNFMPLFNPKAPEEMKPVARNILRARLEWLDAQLDHSDYLLGGHFSVADIYLFTVQRWLPVANVDVIGLKNLHAFAQRVGVRQGVQEALKAEGLAT
jgi:glutathione S-transferase